MIGGMKDNKCGLCLKNRGRVERRNNEDGGERTRRPEEPLMQIGMRSRGFEAWACDDKESAHGTAAFDLPKPQNPGLYLAEA